MLKRKVHAILAAVLCAPVVCSASAIFNDDFSTDDSASWNINKAVIDSGSASHTLASTDGSSIAEFGYDYSALGIPPAPHTTDGSTKGLRLRTNLQAVASINGTTSRTTGI